MHRVQHPADRGALDAQPALQVSDVPQVPSHQDALVADGLEIFAQAIAARRVALARHDHASAVVVEVEGLFVKTCACGWFSIGSSSLLEAWGVECDGLTAERLFTSRLIRDSVAVIGALRDHALSLRGRHGV